jgi:FlaG/FlaF family flagellin (archaellin)
MSFIGMILVGVVALFVIGYYDDITSKKPTTNQSFKAGAK